jgi:hypothetical protein
MTKRMRRKKRRYMRRKQMQGMLWEREAVCCWRKRGWERGC